MWFRSELVGSIKKVFFQLGEPPPNRWDCVYQTGEICKGRAWRSERRWPPTHWSSCSKWGDVVISDISAKLSALKLCQAGTRYEAGKRVLRLKGWKWYQPHKAKDCPLSSIFSPQSSNLKPQSWILGPQSWILGSHSWILGSQSLILNPLSSFLNPWSFILNCKSSSTSSVRMSCKSQQQYTGVLRIKFWIKSACEDSLKLVPAWVRSNFVPAVIKTLAPLTPYTNDSYVL